MARMLKPWGARMLVKPTQPPQKVGGLARPQSQQEKPTEGVVVAVGEGIFSGHIGKTVCWKQYLGQEKTFDGVDYIILREDEISGEIQEG